MGWRDCLNRLYLLVATTLALAFSASNLVARDMPHNFIDPGRADPLEKIKRTIGARREEFKESFPDKNGFAISVFCSARIKPFHKGDTVERVMVVIDGSTCQEQAIDLFRRLYGAPREGGYGYATSIATAGAVSSQGHGVVTLKWCPRDFDVMAIYPANWTNGLSVMVFPSGQYDPESGKRTPAGSAKHIESCPPRAAN